MADPFARLSVARERAKPREPRRHRLGAIARTWLRAIHRDVGYSAVGLTFVYAASGIAVNHVADWDPNFTHTTRTHELNSPLVDDDQAASRQVLATLGIRDVPKEVYREGDELEILLEHRTLHVVAVTGHVVEEVQRPRLFLRAANWLHLNRGKKAWSYFADAYAAALLFLATSGMFMLPGRKGLLGRGAVFMLLGASIPILYVTLARG
jgi:uncharacterized protein